MSRNEQDKLENSGAALLTALGLLFVFSMLGMAYVAYMGTVFNKSSFDLRTVCARHMAEGGVEAAIGQVQDALAAGKAADVLSAPIEIGFPVYTSDRSAPFGLAPHANRRGTVKVSITDESARINLNYAPTRVLQMVLGVDGDTARKIRSSLPVQDAAAGSVNQGWLTSLDDLVTRGLMTPAAFATAPKRILTVYSVADLVNPARFLNVNSAAPEALAAVLDLAPEAAQAVTAKRPFRSLAELSAAAGKDPATFNFKPDPAAPDALPKELCLEPHAFRIVSEAVLSDLGPGGKEYRPTHSRVEAVVAIETGVPRITFWSEAPEGGNI
jgi:type II secretory pathway component PulK